MGSLLGGLFRFVLPLIKRGSKAIGRELLSTASNVLDDIVSDRDISFKESVKNRGRESVDNLKRKINTKMNGGGLRGKRQRLRQSVKSAGLKKTSPPKRKRKIVKKYKKNTKVKKPVKKSGKKKKNQSKEKSASDSFSYF